MRGMKDPIAKDGSLNEWFKGKPGFNYHLHLDPAVNNCSFGVSLTHQEPDGFYIDLAHGFVAPSNQEIDFQKMQEFLGLLVDRFPGIRTCTYDSYIAVSLFQSLKKRGLTAEFLCVDKTHHDNLKIEGIYKSRIFSYPNSTLQNELKDLELINGTKVDHPHGGSKDIADAVAGAFSKALEGGGVELAISTVGMKEVASHRHAIQPREERMRAMPGRMSGFRGSDYRRRSMIWG